MAKITYLDKVALNENADIPDINKVKANDMNEIKDVVNGLIKIENTISDEETYACNYINDLSGKILWTNPNPTTEISSDTQITLSSSDYDYIKIFSRLSLTNNYCFSMDVLKGYGTRLYFGSNYRAIDRNNNTSFTIKPSSDGQGNVMIPQYIIGYKTGIFS